MDATGYNYILLIRDDSNINIGILRTKQDIPHEYRNGKTYQTFSYSTFGSNDSSDMGKWKNISSKKTGMLSSSWIEVCRGGFVDIVLYLKRNGYSRLLEVIYRSL